MTEERRVKPCAMVALAHKDPEGVTSALEKYVSNSGGGEIENLGTGVQASLISKKNYSRSVNEERHPEKVVLGGVTYFKYSLSFLPVKTRERSCTLLCSQFSGALKEFILDYLEPEMENSGADYAFFEFDLGSLKAALERGDNLKGRLRAISSRIDYFGDSELEKVVLRGENVFLSGKYNAIWKVLSGNIAQALVLHSVTVQMDFYHREAKILIDKFGNMRGMFDETMQEGERMAELVKYLSKFSKERRVCPLRRIKIEDSESGDE